MSFPLPRHDDQVTWSICNACLNTSNWSIKSIDNNLDSGATVAEPRWSQHGQMRRFKLHIAATQCWVLRLPWDLLLYILEASWGCLENHVKATSRQFCNLRSFSILDCYKTPGGHIPQQQVVALQQGEILKLFMSAHHTSNKTRFTTCGLVSQTHQRKSYNLMIITGCK